MRKKVVRLLAIGILSLSLMACGKKAEPADVSGENQAETTEEAKEDTTTDKAKDAESEIGNPWKDSSAEESESVFGCVVQTPLDATNVSYQMLNENEMGQMQFTCQELEFTARIQKTEDLTDISGANYDWTMESDLDLAGAPGCTMRYVSDKEMVDVLLWYDEYNGVTYSLMTSAPDLNEFDIVPVGQEVYLGPDPSADGECFMPSDFLQEREQKDCFESFDEIISLLQPGEAYAIIQMKDAKGDLLVITDGTYEDGKGNMVAMNGYVYGKTDRGITNIGNVFSSDKAYPLACDGEVLYTAGTQEYCSYFMMEDGTGLMVEDYIWESTEDGKTSYVGFLRSEKSFDEACETQVEENDAESFRQRMDVYASKPVIQFIVVV